MEYTPVHNRFWSDGWVRHLNALDRYLFLYLLTNGRAKLTGIYELPLDLMASESGIDEKDLRLSMLQRLEPKIYYKEGWVIVINYLKHRIGGGHKYNAGVRANYEELPEKIQALAKSFGYPIDTLSIGYQRFPSIVDKNRIDNTSVATAPRRVLESEEDRPKKESRAKYPHSKEVFSWFPRPEKSWILNTTELKHAELLWERGEVRVRKALGWLKTHAGEEFCPQVDTPSDLERKWSKIAKYAKGN